MRTPATSGHTPSSALATDPATIQVVVGCDDAFARHLSVLLLSLFAHTTSRAVRVHVVVPANFTSQAKLDEALGHHARHLTYRFLGEDLCPDPTLRGYLTFAAYFRCFMGLVVPRSIEKVIYLDCDMIIRRDLTALWETPLAGHVLAAALDPGYDLGFVPGWPSDTPYFNSGVMLVDLARWRAEGIGEAALRFAIDHPDRVRFNDQCALNWTLGGRWLELDPKWNAQFGHFSNEQRGQVGYISPVPPIGAGAWIVHFNTPGRPWLYLDRHPFKPEYSSYLARTPWAEARPPDRHPVNMVLKALGWYGLFLRWAAPRAYWRLRKYI
jgi:lipopolysaccharide biosynthesis glycosyltransferase